MDFTKFTSACNCGETDVVDSMLEKGHIPRANDIVVACSNGHIDIVTRLLRNHIPKSTIVSFGNFTIGSTNNIEDNNNVGKYPMKLSQAFLATAKGGYVDILNHLYLAGVNVNSVDSNGNTALHLAKSVSITEWLLDMGVVFSKNKKGNTPLHKAITEGNVQIVKLLLKYCNNSTNFTNSNGDTLLHLASRSGEPQIVQILLEQLFSSNSSNSSSSNQSSSSNESSNERIAEVVNACNALGFTALHDAVKDGNIKSVKLLLDRGAIQMDAMDGTTAFHLAAKQGHSQVARLLMDYGHVETEDNLSVTPLSYALRNNHFDTAMTIHQYNRK